MTDAGRLLVAPPFTADRTYLHGADIFDGIVDRLGGAADIRLALTAASDCAIELCAGDVRDDEAAPADRCGSVTWREEGRRRLFVLRRRRDLPINRRVRLDEEALIEGATFEGDRRAALPAGDAPFMRRVAAASIHLLLISCPDDYWSIAEIACPHVPPRRAPASVSLGPLLGGRYWKAIATAPDGTGGAMLLARGQPRR
jgi:hypothetical protein